MVRISHTSLKLRAVEDGCCPLSVDLWLALARLEEYQEARKVPSFVFMTLEPKVE